MIGKRFYTIWKGTESGDGEAILLEDEPFFYTKRRAFKRATELAKQLAPNWDNAILVRYVTIGSDMCKEWVFTPPAN